MIVFMPDGRPAIPASIEREVKLESGYRCAMPGCTETRTEMAHILPWSKVQKHEASNLIALCPNDHARFDAGDIPVKAIQHIKHNQVVLSGRYSELEVRVLQFFGEHPNEHRICLDWSMGLLYQRLLDDGFLLPDPGDQDAAMKVNWTESDDPGAPVVFSVPMGPRLLNLTAAGRDLVDRLYSAELVE